MFGVDLLEHVKTSSSGQSNVEDHYIPAFPACEIESLLGVARFSKFSSLELVLENPLQALVNHGVIVNDQYLQCVSCSEL
jgi:hypothetical protein